MWCDWIKESHSKRINNLRVILLDSSLQSFWDWNENSRDLVSLLNCFTARLKQKPTQIFNSSSRWFVSYQHSSIELALKIKQKLLGLPLIEIKCSVRPQNILKIEYDISNVNFHLICYIISAETVCFPPLLKPSLRRLLLSTQLSCLSSEIMKGFYKKNCKTLLLFRTTFVYLRI